MSEFTTKTLDLDLLLSDSLLVQSQQKNRQWQRWLGVRNQLWHTSSHQAVIKSQLDHSNKTHWESMMSHFGETHTVWRESTEGSFNILQPHSVFRGTLLRRHILQLAELLEIMKWGPPLKLLQNINAIKGLSIWAESFREGEIITLHLSPVIPVSRHT